MAADVWGFCWGRCALRDFSGLIGDTCNLTSLSFLLVSSHSCVPLKLCSRALCNSLSSAIMCPTLVSSTMVTDQCVHYFSLMWVDDVIISFIHTQAFASVTIMATPTRLQQNSSKLRYDKRYLLSTDAIKHAGWTQNTTYARWEHLSQVFGKEYFTKLYV